MTVRASLRSVCAALALLLAACGSSSDDDTGGLLDDGGGSGGGDTPRTYTLAIDGPVCIEPGTTASGFTVTATADDEPAGGVFIDIDVVAGDQAIGTVRATTPEGSTRIGGANSDASGVVPFTVTAPTDDISNPVQLTIVATAKNAGADAGQADYDLTLEPSTPPRVQVQGPTDPATGARLGSGQVEVQSGELAGPFLVTVMRGSGGCGAAGALRGATVAVTPQLAAAAISYENEGVTLVDGTEKFDYIAPAVSARTVDTLSVVASAAGTASMPVSFNLAVLPPPPPPSVRVTVSGPTTVAPSQTQPGYTARVETVETGETAGQARQGTRLTVTLSDGGEVIQEPNDLGTIGQTGSDGLLHFSVKPKSTTAANQTIVISAKVETVGDSAATTACALASSRCTGTLDVRVQPDVFDFTAPEYGVQGIVGEPNAVALQFQWQTTVGEPVPACVNLSAVFQGSGSSPYLLKINGDPVPSTQTRQVRLNANGVFQVPVAVFSDRSGFVEIRATENRSCASTTTSGALTASTGVQFVDEICEVADNGQNCVDLTAPLRVLTSPDESGEQRTADLTFKVLNRAYQPVDGRQVTFAITDPAHAGDPNERVFPGGGTTNASGIATSEYFIPSLLLAAGEVATVRVQACVRNIDGEDDVVCSEREIEIVADTE